MSTQPVTDPSPWPNASDAARLIGHLESLVGREGIAEDYVRLRIELLRAQADALEALAEAPSPLPPPGVDEGPPLVRSAAMPVAPGVARPLFARVASTCAARAKEGAGLRRLDRAVEDRPSLLEELVRFAPVPDEWPFAGLAERLEVPVEVLLLVSRVTAAPLVTDLARRLSGAGLYPPPSKGNCPVCGASPGLAELRADDGTRLLHCSLCGYAWPFGRLDCPICGGREPMGIEKLSVEGDPARWVEACRQCRRYLKTVDRRELPPGRSFFPLAEEVAGLYLDLLAEREGCLPGPPYAAGL
jgi:FdhE protein